MGKFKDVLERLGALHDSKISTLDFNIENKSLTIKIRDIYNGTRGLPEDYNPAPRPGTIVMRQVGQFDVSFQLDPAEFHIFDFSVSSGGGGRETATVKLWPAGRITVEYGDVDFLDFPQHIP